MYLTIKQHDKFRTLLMGFEVPYRTYIADVITSKYRTADAFVGAMKTKNNNLSATAPKFLRDMLPKECKRENDPGKESSLRKKYNLFDGAANSRGFVVPDDTDTPMVGALNLVTFALTEDFTSLYTLFQSYSDFCDLAEKYLYCRNKLNHPRCRTLEDEHLIKVLYFVKNICNYLDDEYFLEKSKEDIFKEIDALQRRKIEIPIETHNLHELPYNESRVVCREAEIEMLKKFVYGDPDDVRKPHSLCVYGFGGVGKTVLVLEAVKRIVQDVAEEEPLRDENDLDDYKPEYILFFSAKKRKLTLAQESGKVIEQQVRYHFQTADELIESIMQELGCDSFRRFNKEGLIIVDNLESLSDEDRAKVKNFIDTKTPTGMQFILTSRHSENYDINYRLGGFEMEAGEQFIREYSEENALDLSLSPAEIKDLLTLSKGNTLVLVLCLRRLSRQLCSVSNLRTDFSSTNSWKTLKKNLSQMPLNAYEVISEFMFKDTFEHIESVFAADIDLFYQVLKIFAVSPYDDIDLGTICMLTKESYPLIESTVDTLCSYLILEKKNGKYSMNHFAEKYIINRFLPDAESYQVLSSRINSRLRQIANDLEQLEINKQNHPELREILKDWALITDIDQITAAKAHNFFSTIQRASGKSERAFLEAIDEFNREFEEAERITAHPFIKYQKARILRRIDKELNTKEHTDEIREAYNDAIYAIQTMSQYEPIQNTKSYASLLWVYGQFLNDIGELHGAIRYLEDAQKVFEKHGIDDQEYLKCVSTLAHRYLDYYQGLSPEQRKDNKGYWERAKKIRSILQSKDGYMDQTTYRFFRDLKARLSG